MKRLFGLLCVVLALALFQGAAEGAEKMRFKIRVGNELLAKGFLEDNPISRQLLQASPIKMKMEDYGGSEKISWPPSKLALECATHGLDPKKGDVALFGPWGNIAVYLHDGLESNGLYPLGKIESGLEALGARKGEFEAVWEVAPQGQAE